MTVIKNRFQQILTSLLEAFSGKRADLLSVIFAVAVRMLQLIFFYNIRVDASFQIQATQNLVGGKGITLAQVFPSDLAAIHYVPLINWPPGYSLLLAPFYLLFGQNYLTAGIMLGMICGIALIFTCRAILKLLDFPQWLINMYTVFTALYIYPFYHVASSDAIAVFFLMLSVYLTLKAFKEEFSRWWTTALLVLCLIICGLTKYLFIPLIFIVPSFILTMGFTDRNKRVIKNGILSFFIITVSISILFAYQKITAGAAVYVSQTEQGFFPENLLKTFPALPESVLKLSSIYALFPQLHFFRQYQFIHLLLVLLMFWQSIRMISRRGFAGISSIHRFFYLAFLLSLVNILLLLLLSLFIPEEENREGPWTYAQEARYYGTVIVLFQLCIFALYYMIRKTGRNVGRYAIYIAIVLMCVETARGLVFACNRVWLMGREKYSWQREYEFQKFGSSIINTELGTGRAKHAVVSGSHHYMSNRIAIYDHLPVLAGTEHLNHLELLQTTEPVLLLITLYKRQLGDYSPFLQRKDVRYHGESTGFYFYTTYVQPH